VDVESRGATVVAVGIAKNERGPYRRLPGFVTELTDVVLRIVDDLEAVMT